MYDWSWYQNLLMDLCWHHGHVGEYLEKLLQIEPGKYDDIITGQYMKLRREINIDLIGIDNTTHSGDIAAVHESIFHGTIMSIHEEDT